ncbi:hypothetical protein AB4Z19_15495 [Pseudoduganella sp. RAF19]|uniref:hypothetical protein n=1 Tax=Bacteria TaxID=2 RepID=UPI003F999E5B
MKSACESANLALASLLGWTEIVAVGDGMLLGRPPSGEPACRGQAAVPDWCGSWNACGPLMVEHRCFPELGLVDRNLIYVQRDGKPLGHLVVGDFPSLDHAVRTAVVYAVIMRLKTLAQLKGMVA